MSAIIGLGLVVGFGAMSNVNACGVCDDPNCNYAEEVIEEHIHEDKCTETHYLCGECDSFYCENLLCLCGECNGETSDYIFEQDHNHRHELCEECGEIYGIDECYIGCDCVKRIETEEHEDCICGSFQLQCENCGGLYCQEYACECGRCEGIIDEESKEENVVMTYEELMIFEENIWDIYYEEYCTNYCEECGVRYYEECMCEALENGCGTDCEICSFYDYELFIEDNYDMIMDIYEDIMNQLEEYRIAREKEETVMIICEF